jgi:hypothetical protein
MNDGCIYFSFLMDNLQLKLRMRYEELAEQGFLDFQLYMQGHYL